VTVAQCLEAKMASDEINFVLNMLV